jgi:hypothetical protein
MPAEIEQRLGSDILGHARLEFGRHGRHRRDLHEIEIIEEADPQDAGPDVDHPQEAQHPTARIGCDQPAMKGHDDADHGQKADEQRVGQFAENCSHD